MYIPVIRIFVEEVSVKQSPATLVSGTAWPFIEGYSSAAPQRAELHRHAVPSTDTQHEGEVAQSTPAALTCCRTATQSRQRGRTSRVQARALFPVTHRYPVNQPGLTDPSVHQLRQQAGSLLDHLGVVAGSPDGVRVGLQFTGDREVDRTGRSRLHCRARAARVRYFPSYARGRFTQELPGRSAPVRPPLHSQSLHRRHPQAGPTPMRRNRRR